MVPPQRVPSRTTTTQNTAVSESRRLRPWGGKGRGQAQEPHPPWSSCSSRRQAHRLHGPGWQRRGSEVAAVTADTRAPSRAPTPIAMEPGRGSWDPQTHSAVGSLWSQGHRARNSQHGSPTGCPFAQGRHPEAEITWLQRGHPPPRGNLDIFHT